MASPVPFPSDPKASAVQDFLDAAFRLWLDAREDLLPADYDPIQNREILRRAAQLAYQTGGIEWETRSLRPLWMSEAVAQNKIIDHIDRTERQAAYDTLLFLNYIGQYPRL